VPPFAGKGNKRLRPHLPEGGETELAEGTVVQHDRFGKGKVVKVEGVAPNQKATVFFPEAGLRQLLLKFAKLQVLEE
jgi:DNA helicase-2/ATP-dependent DNA helicase PcrA